MNFGEREALEKQIDLNIDNRVQELIFLNDELAEHPEISGQEYESSAKLVGLLRQWGFQAEYPFAGYDTAFKAFRNEKGGCSHHRKIALLAEYDALPEVGHGCGHCTSGAISLLTGMVLAEIQDELDADIHIIGTPMEETDGAKCAMADRGVFDEYDMVMMIHMMNYTSPAMGFLAMSGYYYSFIGQSAHASAVPWKGKNALNGAQLMLHAVDMLRQHVKPDVRMHAIYTNGGAAPNVVPGEAEIEIYLRAKKKDDLDEVLRKVDDCAAGAALATQTKYKKRSAQHVYDNFKRNSIGENELINIYEELGMIWEEAHDSEGSSDIGNVSNICPTFHPTLKIAEKNVLLHSREFADAAKGEIAHQGIAKGAKILSRLALRLFTDEQKYQNMKKEFSELYG